jgi:hypothetical protein
MIGEIYIASALAIFLAVFGWSEKIFGLSTKHVRLVNSFCEKTGLSYSKYLELMEFIQKKKMPNPGRYMKQLLGILKGSNIQSGDKGIMARLEANSKLLKELDGLNKNKRVYFVALFLYLFIGGSALIYLGMYHPQLFEPNLFAQIILFLIIIQGVEIYYALASKETKIHNNLMDLTTKIGADNRGR